MYRRRLEKGEGFADFSGLGGFAAFLVLGGFAPGRTEFALPQSIFAKVNVRTCLFEISGTRDRIP